VTGATAWVRPTVRAVDWAPSAVAAGCLALLTTLTRWDDTWPAGLIGLAAASVAAGTVAGMRDPAANLMAAMPTSAAVRRAQRLTLLVPVGLGLWIAWIAVGHHWTPELGWPLLGLVALTTAGLAVSVWAPLPVAVALPLLWVVAARAGEFDWELRPGLITVVALAVLWAGRDR